MPHTDHNANIPIYTEYIPTFGESINSVTLIQMHEALQSIETHILLKIMIVAHDLFDHIYITQWVYQNQQSVYGRYWDYSFPCGILVSCLNDKFVFYALGKSRCAIPF